MVNTTSEIVSGAYFDAKAVQLDIDFIQSLTLTKCTKSGLPEPFRLLKPHLKLVTNLLGWKRADGTRLYRRAFFSVARKNAKTAIAAALALDLLVMDPEIQPEVYLTAKDVKQASYCFDAAVAMVQASPELANWLEITPYKRQIRNPSNGGIIEVLSSEGDTKHGANPSAVIFDELHSWGEPERKLWDAMTSGSALRKQPLFLVITTAGVDEHSLWGQQYQYAKSVQNGTIVDPAYLPQIYEVPKECDWTDEQYWHLGNPILGDLMPIDELRAECALAMASPSEQVKFRRFRLNQCISAKSIWVPLHAWDACKYDGQGFLDVVKSYPAYAGLDLAAVSDLTCFSLVWPIRDKLYVYPYFFIPADDLLGRSKQDGVPYFNWVEEGYCEATPGNCTDWEFVTDRIKQLSKQFKIVEVGYDNWQARDTVNRLQNHGIKCVDVSQGIAGITAPAKRFETLVLSKKLVHSGHPVLRWNVECTTIDMDAAGNIKPIKPNIKKSSKRIDGVIATIMAIARWQCVAPAGESVYKARGLLTL